MVYDLALIASGLCMGGGMVAIVLLNLRPSAPVSAVEVTFLDTCKDDDMPSQTFTDALNNLVAAKDAEKAKAVADALANVPQVTDTGPAVDADDTAAVIAATPSA